MQIPLDEDELEDAWKILEARGFKPDDFEFVQSESHPLSPGVSQIWTIVLVRRRANGKTGEYDSGHNTAWLIAFEADLASGKFS
jgi:hypothetical protein